jgi:hypothetical protein
MQLLAKDYTGFISNGASSVRLPIPHALCVLQIHLEDVASNMQERLQLSPHTREHHYFTAAAWRTITACMKYT